MSGIKYLKRKEIDIQAWNRCLDRTPDAQIYGYSWYLDAICDGRWDAIVVGDYEAVFPLPWQRKFGIPVIYQPFFCQQLGLFGANISDFSLRDIIFSIPRKFLKVHLQLRNAGFIPADWKKRTNYLLDLSPAYPELEKNYSQDCRKNLRRIENLGVSYKNDQNYLPIIDLYKEAWGKTNPHITEAHYNKFARACEAAKLQNRIVCKYAWNGDHLLGGAIFLCSDRYLHYVCAAPNADGRTAGIMHGIVDDIIKQFAGTGKVLDFEGSEIESVAAFYKKFQPQRADYFVFYRSAIQKVE